MRRNGRDAPIADLSALASERALRPERAVSAEELPDISFEALFDLDAALAQPVGEMRRT